ncbi:MAG: sugar transferase, partial [Lachnospiraceae bacterium]|nr:sugar transferase [Lachnospiraceae bacterium]
TEALPEFSYRLRVKAGLTGYAQIQGKYNTTPKDKLIMDMMYIEQFSILLDIQLIFQTFIAVIRPDSSEGFMDDKEGNCLGLKLDTSDVGGKAR